MCCCCVVVVLLLCCCCVVVVLLLCCCCCCCCWDDRRMEMVSNSPVCPRLLVCLGSSMGLSLLRVVHVHAGHPCFAPQSRVLNVPPLLPSCLTGPLDALCCVSCQLVVPHDSVAPPFQPPIPPTLVPPPDNEPPADWFSHGPLSRFPSLLRLGTW